MGAKATTIDEQIALLQERGMELNEKKARRVLLDIGYYRLGFYCYPFEKNPGSGKHSYKRGTSLDSVLGLYYFDQRLRELLNGALLRIELNFRTKLIYEVSNAYADSPCWFCDKRYVKTSYCESFETAVYRQIKTTQKLIKKHHQKYPRHQYAPAWKTLEFMTFGQVVTLYDMLLDGPLKKRVANYYGLSDLKEFVNCLDTLRRLRNTCAHGDVLFDYRGNFRRSVKGIPTQAKKSIGIINLFRLVEILSYMLSKIEKPLGKKLEADVLALFSGQEPETLGVLRKATGYEDI